MKNITTKPHLGGHANITHIESKSIEYLKHKYSIRSAYDLGCGPGGMVKHMQSMGINSIGIDGDPTVKADIIHDFNDGPLVLPPKDFCLSIEFLEHVEECYMDNYFTVFNACKVILCTASTNPRPRWHVNVQETPYWIDQFAQRNWKLNQIDTDWVRNNSDMRRNFIRTTGMVFTQ